MSDSRGIKNQAKALRPFWTFFGGKWRLAPRYPAPEFDVIVEPFAGAAGYSLRYPERDVILVEKDPMIAAMWRWLISATPDEVHALPLLPDSGRIDDVEWPCVEARNLAGFWITRGAAHPNNRASAWMRDPRYIKWSWGHKSIERIASQVGRIKHWQVIEGDYSTSPDIKATWFIDPPYIKAGVRYRHGSNAIDFGHLGNWCQQRSGQAMVCEQAGAEWLPFEPFYMAKANESVNGGKISAEVIWTNTSEACKNAA